MDKNKTYKELLLTEDQAEEIMITATEAAHKEALEQGAPINQDGDLEFDDKGGLIGFPEYGRILREELVKLIPEELLVLVRKTRPKEHIERWNHPFAIMHIFWMGYCEMEISEEEIVPMARGSERTKIIGEA